MGAILAGLAWMLTVLGMAFGWIMNVINMINGSYEEVSQIVIGAIGVFIAPVGALVYYFAG